MIEAIAHISRIVYLFVCDWPRTKNCTRYGPVARFAYASMYALGLD